jgi:thiopeptide-type bacteriocin biosynthesis protein
MDVDLELPVEVTTELAKAIDIGWRLAPAGQAPVDQMADYRIRFLSHYGTQTLVPIKELVDPQRGIGPPAGYLLPPGTSVLSQRTSENENRDRVLLGLAQRAAAHGEREMVLDDELIGLLERPGSDRPRPIEVCTRLLANSEESLLSGDFRLALSGLNFTRLGAMFGRLLPVVPDLRPAVTDLISDRITNAVPAQLVTALVGARLGNVSQVPPMTGHRLPVGVFADRSEPGTVDLDDLVVGADQDRFFVLSSRTGEEVVPLPLHALNATNHLPNVSRLLVEIGASHTPPWQIWNWGAAEQLPYLPRIRYERTILSPARWLVDPVLSAGRLEWSDWLRKFEQWRTDWRLPDIVYAVRSDRRLRVDLRSELDLRLLYDDLRNQPSIVLQEEPAGGTHDFGWAQGHCTEIVVPLGPTEPLPARHPNRTVPSKQPVHQPGGEWLSVRVYADSARHSELLTEHLPTLVNDVTADRWFFLRYTDERPHLRVRFHGEPDILRTQLTATVHDWATELTATGMVSDIMFDAYRPEVDRYGGPAAIDAAERAFCADSSSVLTQLALRASGKLDLPIDLLVAANCLDLAEQLSGEGWRDWFLGAYAKGSHHVAFQHRRKEALRLLDPAAKRRDLAGLPGGVELLAAWASRAPALIEYGHLVRTNPTTAFSSILHMHHNRLSGINRGAENAAYAVARGVLQTGLDRERHQRA